MRRKKNRLPVGKQNLRIELEATSEGTRTATIAIDVSFINYALITLTSGGEPLAQVKCPVKHSNQSESCIE